MFAPIYSTENGAPFPLLFWRGRSREQHCDKPSYGQPNASLGTSEVESGFRTSIPGEFATKSRWPSITIQMFAFRRRNSTVGLIGFAVLLGGTAIYTKGLNFREHHKRNDHSELSVIARLLDVAKWIDKLPPPAHVRGAEMLPLTLFSIADDNMVYYDGESGNTWYFLAFDKVEDVSEKGFAYCKADNAPMPSSMGKFQVRCKPMNSHWVQYDVVFPTNN